MRNKNNNHDKSAYRPLESMPDPVLQPERVLFLHVVAQAVIDATSRDKSIRKEVVDWLEDDDFEVVCGMAGLDHSYMRHVITSLLKDRNRKRAFKKAMEFRFLVRTFVESHMGEVDKRRGG